MALKQPTKDLLQFLAKNPPIRSQIVAPPNKTLLYAGHFFKPIWKELADLKRSNKAAADKVILPEVLQRILTPGTGHANLLDWAKSVDSVQPWNENGFIAWRALSGIFASNASGAVSFSVGSGVTKSDKVFAATELAVLMRNPQVDAVTKDILGYFQRCVQNGTADMNFGFIAG